PDAARGVRAHRRRPAGPRHGDRQRAVSGAAPLRAGARRPVAGAGGAYGACHIAVPFHLWLRHEPQTYHLAQRRPDGRAAPDCRGRTAMTDEGTSAPRTGETWRVDVAGFEVDLPIVAIKPDFAISLMMVIDMGVAFVEHAGRALAEKLRPLNPAVVVGPAT